MRARSQDERVRISLDSKVYSYVYQVTIAIADIEDKDFEENNHGSLTCSFDFQDSARSKKCREGWLGSPTSFQIELRGLPRKCRGGLSLRFLG